MKPKSLSSVLIKFFLLIFCSLPYAFFGMNADATTGSVAGHLIMCLAIGLSLIIASKTKHLIFLFSGNSLSFIFSFYLILHYQTDKWSYYFKPFTSLGFLIFVSSISWMIQLVILYIMRINKETK